MDTLVQLENLWYGVFVFGMIAYSVLDGFDLGVGAVYLFTKGDQERRTLLSAIGPVWDGNEVWLVILGGSLMAGFPAAYAAIFSSFYDPLMILLFSLMLRAVSIEFRSKLEHKGWRRIWDCGFAAGSIMVALSLGLVLGNFVEGIPLNEHHEFISDAHSHLHPYSILVSLATLSLLTMHGTFFLLVKTEGALQQRIRRWANRAYWTYILFFTVVTVVTFWQMTHLREVAISRPVIFVVGVALVVFLTLIKVYLHKERDSLVFLFSALAIASLNVVYALSSFPVLLRAKNAPEQYSLTTMNSAASSLTLSILLMIVIIGLPLVFGYTIHTYRVFRGKVKNDQLIY